MKLAEGLILRGDYQKRLAQLKQRLLPVVRIQEGEEPAEKPQDLLAELERISIGLTQLIQRINRTNSATILESGLSLSDGLAERDILSERHTIYRELAQAASITQQRF